jgi:hypothetical protein
LVTGFAGLGLAVPAAPTDEPAEVEISGDIWWLNKDSRGGLWINGREKIEGESQKPTASQAGDPTETADSTGTQPTPTETVSAASVGSDVTSPAAQSIAPVSGELPLESAPAKTSDSSASTSDSNNVLSAIRLLLKETKTGGFAGKIDRVAGEVGKSDEELTNSLLAAGLKIPEKAREKPVFVEHAGEIFWLNKNAKGELWVNAKASKFADKSDSADGATGDSAEDGKKPVRRVGPRPKKSAETTEQTS